MIMLNLWIVGVGIFCNAPPHPYKTMPALGGQKKETAKNNIHNFMTKKDSHSLWMSEKLEKYLKNAEKHSRKGALGKKVKPIEQYFTLKLKPVVTKKTELEKMKNNEKNVVVLYEPNNSKEKINFFKKMTSAEEQGLMD